jgi:mannose-6-phosphate isomerase-like protein (cupin superfamily)
MSMKPYTIKLTEDEEFQKLFDGPPNTVGFHSGRVVLKPGQSHNKHNTKRYEEIIIVLEGEGQAISKDEPPMELNKGIIAYIPPHTEHNVKNTGKINLKYIYIVSPTE